MVVIVAVEEEGEAGGTPKLSLSLITCDCEHH